MYPLPELTQVNTNKRHYFILFKRLSTTSMMPCLLRFDENNIKHCFNLSKYVIHTSYYFSVRPKRVNTKYTKYRSFSILTEPNNTEPNLILKENIGSSMCLFLLYFCVTIFQNFIGFFWLKKRNEKKVIVRKPPTKYALKCPKDSVQYSWIP